MASIHGRCDRCAKSTTLRHVREDGSQCRTVYLCQDCLRIALKLPTTILGRPFDVVHKVRKAF